jgi:hypothetical protein
LRGSFQSLLTAWATPITGNTLIFNPIDSTGLDDLGRHHAPDQLSNLLSILLHAPVDTKIDGKIDSEIDSKASRIRLSAA